MPNIITVEYQRGVSSDHDEVSRASHGQGHLRVRAHRQDGEASSAQVCF